MDSAPQRTPPPGMTRLEAVSRLVHPGSRVADIGTGDGCLPLGLLRSGRAAHCIAVERSPASARGLESLQGLAGLEIRYGDGMTVLRPADRVEVLVMSGFGTRSMLRVLDQSEPAVQSLRRVVLQPQTEVGLLRRWLLRRDVGIVAESMVEERGRFYQIVAAEPGAPTRIADHPSLDRDELLEVGPLLVCSGDPLVAEYWSRDLRRILRILSRSPERSGTRELERRRALATRVLAAIASGPG